jgi:hypothetical protein
MANRPFNLFRTAVGYDRRMLLHCQTVQTADSRLPLPPGATERAQADAIADCVGRLVADVEATGQIYTRGRSVIRHCNLLHL